MSDAKSDNVREELKASEDDRRYFPRWEVNNKVICKLTNQQTEIECSSHDINCAGASIYTDQEVSPDQKVKLVIRLDEDVSVQVTGKVCWKKVEDNQHLIGIDFEETSRKAQDLILKYAFELDKEKLRKHWFSNWSDSG